MGYSKNSTYPGIESKIVISVGEPEGILKNELGWGWENLDSSEICGDLLWIQMQA